MADWVVTLPENVPAELREKFFKAAYDFLNERYGKENMIGASVHMDEKRPHMHYHFMPVYIDEKGLDRLNAKKVLSRTELSRFHKDLDVAMEKAMGFKTDVHTGITQELGGNMTIKELKDFSKKLKYQLSKMPVIEAKEKLLDKDHVTIKKSDFDITSNAVNSIGFILSTMEQYADELDKAKKKAAELEQALTDSKRISEKKISEYNEIKGLYSALETKYQAILKSSAEVSNLQVEVKKMPKMRDRIAELERNNQILMSALGEKTGKLENKTKEYNNLVKEHLDLQKECDDYLDFMIDHGLYDQVKKGR